MDSTYFDDIRPFLDHEVNQGLKRVTSNQLFIQICNWLFPNRNISEIIEEMNKVNSSLDFQKKFMYPAIYSILDKTSDGLSFSGFENLSNNKFHLYISNHRDILLDSAILQVLLVDHNLETSEISFGSNLMLSDFVVDAGKINRMFKVERAINSKEALLKSKKLSEYIHYTINTTKRSVWLAHRKGRTKNGIDQTDSVIIKMLEMSNKNNSLEHLLSLNIIPMSISYEYEPCDILKAIELYYSQDCNYTKQPGEDLNSIIKGIVEYKGRVHLSLNENINNEIINIAESTNKNELALKIAKLVDRKIIENYKLWPTNYIAADMLEKSNKFSDNYTKEEKDKFTSYKNKRLEILKENRNEIEQIFVKIYANPVYNFLNNRNLL